MITVEHLQENLTKIIKSEVYLRLPSDEIRDCLKDSRLTSKQLKRVLQLIVFRDIDISDGSGSIIRSTIRDREDFESLIEDFEFATVYSQAVNILRSF